MVSPYNFAFFLYFGCRGSGGPNITSGGHHIILPNILGQNYMVIPYHDIWTHETPSTKKNEKEPFSSRLAQVNARTPWHAKMPILTDIIKYACNRFNIDPKDLCDDPDSSARSKSSSRAPAEGDENVDWLALDTQKDVITAKLISWKHIKGESRPKRSWNICWGYCTDISTRKGRNRI